MILKEYDLSVRLPQERTTDTGITLVQNDKGVYKLNVRIFDGVNEIDYTDVTSATITFLKRDNNVVQGNMTVEADQLSYTLGTNEIACPGKVLVGIQLWGSTERLSTARFVMQVEKDLITEDAVQSTSEFSVLQQLKQDLEAIDVVDLTNQFNAHKAENVSQIITFDRDSTLTGQQIVSGFNRIPKSITVFTNISNSKKYSIGFVTKSLQLAGSSSQIDQNWANSTHAIKLVESTGNEIRGKITINDNKTITIDWTKIGNGTTGNMTCFLMAYYHGGE